MSQAEEELEEPEDPVKVSPINIVETGNREYKYPYRFGTIAVEEFESCSINKVTTRKTEDGNVLWKYGDKPTVMVTEDGVFADDAVRRRDAQNQAYFALNYMAQHGLVSGWSKQ